MLRRALSRPLPLLLLIAGLLTFLIQSGELGTSDTTHRLQVTHSLWTSEPQVFPNEYPEFGLHGRGGKLYASYGIGQSLLMLPADLLSTASTHLPLWRNYVQTEADPTIRSILVSISTNILLSVLTALAGYRLLGMLGFSTRESIAGTLGLICATTHLHYAQNMTENNFIFLLTITGLLLQYRWLVTGDRRSLLWGSAALGFNLLTRITTVLDLTIVAGFLLLVALFTKEPALSGQGRDRIGTYLQTALPVYAVFVLIDRVYQFIRFGSWTDTYVSILSRETRRLDPTLPASFPFDGHWFQGGLRSGLLGPLFEPEKSIFLFDPLFPLTLLLAYLLWKRLDAGVRAYFVATVALVSCSIGFYGHYDSWGGDFAWGDRYVSSAVQMTSLLAVAVLVRYWSSMRRSTQAVSIAVLASSVIIQAASLAFWLPLEIYQGTGRSGHTWVVFLRLKNIAAFALHRREAWGLNAAAIDQDPWDAVHLTSWYVLPSLLRHIGVAPLWAVHLLYVVWACVGIALVLASVRLFRVLLSEQVAEA